MSRAKRGATTDLNHDNWDKEEEKEEAGVFRLAPPEEIERRVIKQAVRRKNTTADSNNGTNVFGCLHLKSNVIPVVKPNPGVNSFNFLGGNPDKVPNNQISDPEATKTNAFGNVFPKGKTNFEYKTAGAFQSFDFLGGNKDKIQVSENITFANQSKDMIDAKTTVTGNLNIASATASTPESTSLFVGKLDEPPKSGNIGKIGNLSTQPNSGVEKNKPTFSSPSSLRDFVEPTFRKYSHLISKPATEPKKTSESNKSGRSEEFLQGIKEINESFSKWVQNNLAEDPTSILTRCFKDYIRHVQTLFDQEKKDLLNEDQLELLKKQEQVLNEIVLVNKQPDLEVATPNESQSLAFDN